MNNPTGDGTALTWGYRVPKMGHEMMWGMGNRERGYQYLQKSGI
jgi:hypothetical protein